MKRVSVLWAKHKVQSECRIHGNSDPSIETVSFLSGSCTTVSAFVAIKGIHTDGHAFIPEAIANGAPVIIHSAALDRYRPEVLYIRHPNPRRIASLFAHGLASGIPRRIVGVTGTDGKSTTCDFLWQLLNGCGIRCGLLSTVWMDDGTGKVPSPYRQSTPEVPELYAFLSCCHGNGLDTVILETTSHGLSAQGSRLADLAFCGAVYTSLTSEHLEFHKDIDSYVDAKMNLARQVSATGWIVAPHDFPFLRLIGEVAKETTRICTHALECNPEGTLLSATTVDEQLTGRTVMAVGREAAFSQTIALPYGESCYAENALGAILACVMLSGLSWETVLGQARQLQPVPGRFEIINSGAPCTVVIDFAHTADAFERLFTHVRAHRPTGRIIAVFGAAGERDRSKRFPMGASAGRWCDEVYLTDEDPRNESPSRILSDLEAGIASVSTACRIHRIHDRERAIQEAIGNAREEDIVLLLAKSHERTIQYATYARPWDEREVARAVLRKKGDGIDG